MFSEITGVSRLKLYRWDKNNTLNVRRDEKGKPYYTDEDLNHYFEVIKPNSIGTCRNTFTDLGNGVTECKTLKGDVFYISTEDKQKLIDFGRTWGARRVKNNPELFYPAIAHAEGIGSIYLHTFLMQPPKGMEVDHVDRVPMNCCKDNLRVVTKSINCYNRSSRKHKQDNLPKGVTRVNNGFVAHITVDGKRKYLGFSKDPEVVIRLRAEAENKYLKGVIL